ncbi:MAG TPA: hypothetical protein VFJ67_01760 [Thermodesulfobacteriota bacterium]|nr:hypothetical protein [Thermodesulfobacteriota bacterium]
MSVSVSAQQPSRPNRIVWVGIEEFREVSIKPGRINPASGDANEHYKNIRIKFRYVEERDLEGKGSFTSRHVEWTARESHIVHGIISTECKGEGSLELGPGDMITDEQMKRMQMTCKEEHEGAIFGYFWLPQLIDPPDVVEWEMLRDDCSYSEERPGYRYSVWVSPEIDAVMKVETGSNSEYKQFVPRPGEQITFTVRSNVPARFRFRLEDVSHFAGFATNADIKPYFFHIYGLDHLEGKYETKKQGEPLKVDPDLIFDPKLYEDRAEWEQPTYETVTTAKESASASVTVTAMDYAAYGRLKTEVKGKCGGWEPVRILVGGEEKEFVTIPLDENDNLMSDKMDEPQNGITDWGYDGDAGRDDDRYPQGDGTPGDGFTAFEEYRGFMTQGANFAGGCDDRGYDLQIRTDPGRKDLFIYSPDPELAGLALRFENSTKGAEDLKGIGVHLICEPHSVARKVNYTLSFWGPKEWRGKTLFGGDQHGLNLLDASLEDGTLGLTHGTTGLGPPKDVWGDVKIDKNKIFSMGDRPYFNAPLELAKTVLHELGHAVGIDHHGDSNVYLALLITDKPCPGVISDPLVILGDGISVTSPPLSAGERACVIFNVARRHAQNSGNQACPMKYTYWNSYESPSSPLQPMGDIKLTDSQRRHATLKGYRGEIHEYRRDLDTPSLGPFCDKATGTGINGYPGEANHAGDSCRVCAGQIRVKDWDPSPHTPPACPAD